MIDFHSHILPSIDDGATDCTMSIKMLKDAYNAGIHTVVSTSHCYPKTEADIENFLQKRADAYANLKQAISSEENIPKIVLGCEVNVSTDLAELKNIKKLCIENTDYLLVEMPHGGWEEWMVDSVYKLTLLGIRPIMAHIDRYMFHDKELFRALSELGFLYQVNSDLFVSKGVKRIANHIIHSGHLHILGSDMHNITTRKSTLAKAIKVLSKRYGEDAVRQIYSNSVGILNNEEIEHYFLKAKKRRFLF